MLKKYVLIFLLFALSSCATLPDRYLDLTFRETLTFEKLLKQIEYQDVIFVGEFHDDTVSHKVQLEVIRHLHRKGHSVAIAYEMFPASNQDLLDQWVEGTISPQLFVKQYQSIVHMHFRHYRDIFTYARESGIRIYGINAERSIIGNAARNGIGSVPEEYRDRVKFTGCHEDTEYADLFGFSEGKKFHAASLPYLCDAQRLRDAIMAYNIAELTKNNRKIVVITGVAHALKAAVPAFLAKHTRASIKVIVPEKIRYVIDKQADHNVTDYIWY
ncbi:MAG: ChaN family lipoprotein [Nitrospiraceae bacterium]|nr:MAG: ChaN family lipoprotein [Nitrospiraceae bacterium]